MEDLLTLGCDVRQAAGVTANSINESGWGQMFRWWNLGGWKITRVYAVDYLKNAGLPAPYWVAPGNKAPNATPSDPKGGDPPWCYYRCFGTQSEYLREWMAHFVPRPDEHAPYQGYRHCGEIFWSGSPTWFKELCLVGYKGTNTKKDPSSAVAEHVSLVRGAIVRWAQGRLGVAVDGLWGGASQAALDKWGATDLFDAATCAALKDGTQPPIV